MLPGRGSLTLAASGATQPATGPRTSSTWMPQGDHTWPDNLLTERRKRPLWRAVAACPTKSIGNRDRLLEPDGIFPYQLTEGVFALGNNALSSFAAHSFLILHPDGNLMVDSPRFNRPLAQRLDALGGIAHILLTHRDDVADADRWADRYGARVWIGEADADARPHTPPTFTGSDSSVAISSGVASIPAPGHTKGHVVYHLDNRCLFTGDTLPLEPPSRRTGCLPKPDFPFMGHPLRNDGIFWRR